MAKKTEPTVTEQQAAPETSNAQPNVSNDAPTEQKPSNEPVKVEEPTSEALLDIRAKIDDALTSLATITDRKAKLDVVLNLQKLQAAETSEIANIKKALLDAKLTEARNAKIALIDAVLDAKFAEQNYKREVYDVASEDEQGKKPQPILDELNRLSDNFKTAFDKLATELVGGVKVSAPKASGGTTSNGTGKTKSEQIEDMMRAGNTYDEMIAAGMGDGTIRTVAGNIKFRKLANGQYAPRD